MLRVPIAIAAIALLAVCGCAPTRDPRVKAAEDFRSTVFDLIARDEDQAKRFNSLRLGMLDQEVLEAAGAPARRESRTTESGRGMETWVYDGQLSTLGTLTFENGRQMQTN